MSFLLRCVFIALIVSLSFSALAKPLRVAIASNFLTTIKQISQAYELETGQSVDLIAGSSGKIYAQIQHGAPFDLFFSADQEKPLLLEQQGLTVAGSRQTYAIGQLVFWSNQLQLDQATAKAQLLGFHFKRLAVANPKLAPYGAAAAQVLSKIEFESQHTGQLIIGENINQAFQFVLTGSADWGLVALSQVIGRPNGTQWPVPLEWYTPIAQDRVMLKQANQQQAELFLEFFQSPKAQKIMKSFGYLQSSEVQ